MDKRRSVLNVTTSIVFKMILLVSNLLVRRYLIRYVGNDVNGLNSLYLSILGVLAVAELGVGDAITFCMYKPIVDGDTEKVSVLYVLFKRVYLIIGAVITIAGCAVMPFLPSLAKGYTDLDINLYLTFILMLISVVITYLFSANTSLMNAYRDDYVTTTITYGGHLLQHLLQLFVLFKTKSFVWYLLCRIITAGIQWIVSEIVARKKYPAIQLNTKARLDNETRTGIIQNIKAMFMHRIGGVLVNTIDSIVISAFVGLVILGKYSNYTTIMTAMTGTITLFFTPLTSTIGHLFVQDKDACKRYYNFFCAMNFALGCIFFLGYYGVIDDLITLLFGAGLEMERSVSFVITLNCFIQFMRQSTLLFRNASGTFYHDCWKPLVEGLSNLVLSIAFVALFRRLVGDDFAVVGVILATIITNVFICHVIEPYVLHRYAFHTSPKKYYLQNYCYIAVFIALLFVLDLCMVSLQSRWLELLVNGGIAIGISLFPIAAIILLKKDFRHYARSVLQKIRAKLRRT